MAETPYGAHWSSTARRHPIRISATLPGSGATLIQNLQPSRRVTDFSLHVALVIKLVVDSRLHVACQQGRQHLWMLGGSSHVAG
jgi:hypothetical protein